MTAFIPEFPPECADSQAILQLNFPVAPVPLRWQLTVPDFSLIDEPEPTPGSNSDQFSSNLPVGRDMICLRLGSMSASSTFPKKPTDHRAHPQLNNINEPFLDKGIELQAMWQFATVAYNRANIGILVAVFMSTYSDGCSMFIPSDIFSIVFRFYYEEENEILHLGYRIFDILNHADSQQQRQHFTGTALLDAVERCYVNHAHHAHHAHHPSACTNTPPPRSESHRICQKLLRFKYLKLASYVSTFSAFCHELQHSQLQTSKHVARFDENHSFSFVSNRIEQYSHYMTNSHAVHS
mmetsp:Transcript_12802/g.20363  ORF Transcript_12802/g.20363 Transcript_12802/m.20363 type:complete len:295 (-) Transcript_12802:373-1257(-)|eukprot:CAMPEP_0197032484 /NCGR_PEP_ID=MMETSP1384-20130603/11157_1 /TAXON_ID=29189 /ORGANISM="Ammonia sp." /LENGTH=294 /DNA_ID=CAMNT_0042462157 /DNA_START=54 /DNA_END=938 /DNA_ORIENTATION=+